MQTSDTVNNLVTFYCWVCIYLTACNNCVMNFVKLAKFRLFLLILIVILIWQTLKFFNWFATGKVEIYHDPDFSGVITPVLVTVFYEALCPDSKNFVIKQLLPTVNKASRLVNVTLVPYGKAKTENLNGRTIFSCQHGPTECLANKIHACAISKISNSILQIKYIACMITDNMIPEMIGQSCAKELSVDWESIYECTNSDIGISLLKYYGEVTSSLQPKMTFVPTVLLDNDQMNQAAILKNLFKEVCKLFKKAPNECIQNDI